MTTIQEQRKRSINPKMHPKHYEDPDMYDVKYLDNLMFKAFTVQSSEDVRHSTGQMADVAAQCLRYINYLTDLEAYYRSFDEKIQYEHGRESFNDVIKFLAGIGTCAGSVMYQLGSVNNWDLPPKPHE